MTLPGAALVSLSVLGFLALFPAVCRAETPLHATRTGPLLLAAQEQTLAEEEQRAKQQAGQWLELFDAECKGLLSRFPIHDEASTLPGGMKAAVESYKQASDMISKLRYIRRSLKPEILRQVSDLDMHAMRCKTALGEIAPRADNIATQRNKAVGGWLRACEATSVADAEAAAADTGASYRMARAVYAVLAKQVNWNDLKAQGELYQRTFEDISNHSEAARRYGELYAKTSESVTRDLGGYEGAVHYFIAKRRDLDEAFPRVKRAYDGYMSVTFPYRGKGWASSERTYVDDQFRRVGQVMNRFPDESRLDDLRAFGGSIHSGGGPETELPDPRHFEALMTADMRMVDFLKCVGDVQAQGKRAHADVTGAYNNAVDARDCARKIAARQPAPAPAAAGTCRSGHVQCRGSNWCCPSQDYCWDQARLRQAVDRGTCYRPR